MGENARSVHPGCPGEQVGRRGRLNVLGGRQRKLVRDVKGKSPAHGRELVSQVVGGTAPGEVWLRVYERVADLNQAGASLQVRGERAIHAHGLLGPEVRAWLLTVVDGRAEMLGAVERSRTV